MEKSASNLSKSSKSQCSDDEELGPRQTCSSLGDCTNGRSGPSSPEVVEQKGLVLKRTQSEPNNLQRFIKSTPFAFINDLLKTNIVTPACEASPSVPSPTTQDTITDESNKNTISSKFSLRFQSPILGIANRSNVTVESSISFREDDSGIHSSQASATIKSEPLPTQMQSVSQELNEINAEITVLYSDNVSFNSSESLIAKDSMGQSRLNLTELRSMQMQSRLTDVKGTSATVCTTQPPPYHVATAHDTASVQLTPAAAQPLVLYSAPPLQGAPPTYSALMRIGPEEVHTPHRLFSRRDVQIQPSSPFIAPPPPPSYAQAQGFCVAHPLQFADPQDSVWSTEPITVICPYCNNFVVTTVRYRRSNLTHYSALALCICGCWPCCLLPYCMKSCKCVHHECPICSNIVGIYSPWQVS